MLLDNRLVMLAEEKRPSSWLVDFELSLLSFASRDSSVWVGMTI